MTSSGAPRTQNNRSHTVVFWCPSRTGMVSWRPLCNRSSCAKRFNPSEYCVTIRDRSITRNIELSTEKTLNSNNGIVISEKTAWRQKQDAQRSTAAWLLNWSLCTILRRSGEVADLHSPDYYPFQKHAFFLCHPVYVCVCGPLLTEREGFNLYSV